MATPWKRTLTGLMVLAASTGLIVVAVLALSRILVGDVEALSTTTTVSDGSPSAAAPTPNVPTESTTPLGLADLTGADRAFVLTVVGDRPGSDIMIDDYEGQFEGSNGRLVLSGDDESGIFVDGIVWDGLNFLLGPGDCPFREVSRADELGLVEVAFDCGSQTDAADNAEVELSGAGYLSELEWDADVPELTVSIELSGDVNASFEFYLSPWVLSGNDPDSPVGDEPPQLFAHSDESPPFAVDLNSEALDLWVSGLTIDPANAEGAFTLGSGQCPITYDIIDVVGPETELGTMSATCPGLMIDNAGTVDLTLEGLFLRIPLRLPSFR